MKSIRILLLGLMLLFTGSTFATEKVKAKIASVKQNGELVYFSVTSTKPFIFGSNKYYLHIGDKEFSRAEQSKSHGKGRLTFLIPKDDFGALKEGANVFLTYGNPSQEDGSSFEELSKIPSARCWALGKFSKAMLEK